MISAFAVRLAVVLAGCDLFDARVLGSKLGRQTKSRGWIGCGRAVLIAAIDRAFAAAELPRLNIIAKEDLAADLDALGTTLPAARIEPLLGIHCVTLRDLGDSRCRAQGGACHLTLVKQQDPRT